MCGICGQVIHSQAVQTVDSVGLEQMANAIAHRGPDEAGFYVDPERKAGLGFRRLRIIDLVTGSQPLCNEDKSVWVVFNGEIYNFQDLRKNLESQGHVFKTQTDTETIVHAYEEFGKDFVDHLRGMFAIGLWDNINQRLILARDRLGKKPLYYYRGSQEVIFGSELKALLQLPQTPREVSQEALSYYLTYGYIPAPLSILENVYKLPPAHILVYEAKINELRMQSYWNPNYLPKLNLDLDEAEEALLTELRQAIKLRLISDVPLGALLSGGIDSSLVVALMAEMSPKVETFTIGFEESNFDERKYARIVADRYATKHHEMVVRPEMMSVLPDLVHFLDEPMADPSVLPTYYVSQMARKEVTVVLNGDGGDESFGGYWHYGATLNAQRFSRLPNWFREGVLRPISTSLSKDRPFFVRLLRLLDQSSFPISSKHEARMTLFPSSPLQNYLPNGYEIPHYFQEIYAGASGLDNVDAMLRADLLAVLPGQLLVKMDRMSMGHSLEARSPLLDQQVVEFAARLPSKFKIAGSRQKILLRKLARHFIPPALIDRQKKGFAVPLERWLYRDYREPVNEILLDTHSTIYEYLPMEFTKNLLECDVLERPSNSSSLWALLILETWLREVFNK